jgi:multisubunit Na+/H+ antiporter MnhE subunit
MRRGLVMSLLGLALTGGFYLLLIDTVSSPELYAGAVVALLGAGILLLAREHGSVEPAFSIRWWLRVGRVLRRAPVETLIVSRVALQQLVDPKRSRGAFRAIPFEPGGHSGPDAGRRAVAEALGSLTPNTIVVGIDPERKLLLVHQLQHRGGSEELDVLGLG